jgi:signal peptidase I
MFDWGQALMYAIVIILLGLTFFGRMLSVSGNSMLNTLHDNEFMLVSNLFYNPGPGDIVVFIKSDFDVWREDYGRYSVEPLVKRVIAVAGQTVEVDYANQRVLVDGAVIDEPYVREPVRAVPDREVDYPYTVPQGHVFVMGDNRNATTDSRQIGPVDNRMIIGRLILRLTPFSKFGPVS